MDAGGTRRAVGWFAWERRCIHASLCIHMYGRSELYAHQLCVNICLCKDAHVGLGLTGVPVRSGHAHLRGTGGHAHRKVYVCACEAWAHGLGWECGC